MGIDVLMIPHLARFAKEESGIRRVVEAYFKYLPDFDVNLVDVKVDSFDILAVHAGTTITFSHDAPTVSHCHGLYWTSDYPAASWEWRANANVTVSLMFSNKITVPSEWVAETLRRDMRLNPIIVHHGIECQEWEHDYEHEGYILWNKNRDADVCDPSPILRLARRFTRNTFVTTFAPDGAPSNVKVTGIRPHHEMKRLVQSALAYLSTTKETFGIGTLEALAAGTPVLGYAHGGNLEMVQHGVNGYLARPGDEDDLAEGLLYIAKHRNVLSENAKITARKFTWREACKTVADVYREALAHDDRPYHIDMREYAETIAPASG